MNEPRTDILGVSPALRAAVRAARRVAPTSASVVVRGESGTGKELFARLIHETSRRRGAFVPVNCAALPEALLESMLFGHRRGAFTGATESAQGLVVAADGGTLFLDEIGEMPASVQAKLLRVLQQRSVMPVGETRERRVDVRVVAASHRDLTELVAAGRFREDLYYRLARFELALPPLRERGRDVVLIARSILARGTDGAPARSLGRGAEAALVAYAWPGNVRELENVLFRASLRSTGRSVTATDVCAALPGGGPAEPAPLATRVLQLVDQADGVGSGELADALGVPRSTLKRLLKALVEAGDLVAVGVGKATRYRRPVEDAGPAPGRQAVPGHQLRTRVPGRAHLMPGMQHPGCEGSRSWCAARWKR